MCSLFFFQAEDGIRDLVRSRGLGDVYKRQIRDTFIHRGKMNWTTPQASLGFSAGGAFSTVLALSLIHI